MIKKIEVTGVHYKLEEAVEQYLNKKIQKLERYVPKYARESLHVDVRLQQPKARAKGQKLSECEVVLGLPHEVISAKETAGSMLAAIDAVEEKLKLQLKSYKGKHSHARLRGKIAEKLRARLAGAH